MLEPLTVAVMGLELALIIQSKPVRIASDNFGSNSASAFQADAYQQKPHLLLVGRAKPIQSPPLRFVSRSMERRHVSDAVSAVLGRVWRYGSSSRGGCVSGHPSVSDDLGNGGAADCVLD